MVAKASFGALLTASLFLFAHGNPVEPSVETVFARELAEARLLTERALSDSPDGYTPADVNCPSTRPVIRPAHTLSQNEQDWLQTRRAKTIQPLRELLGRLNITGLDTNAYIDNHKSNTSALPNIGISVSGGGYRALLNGAGVISAFDSRTPNSTSKGHVGGVLQAATYISGLSGGSWLVGSLYVNNFTTVQTLLSTPPDNSATGGLWQFGRTILQGPLSGVISVAKYYVSLFTGVDDKEKAGFNTTLTDYWGRALSFQLFNATEGGPGFTWSSIADTPDFNQANAPLPIVVADGRAPGEIIISLNTTVFEFNPWEMGSFDPQLFGFAPLRYVGSNFTNGALPNSERCVRGLDNVGYVVGTSSSLFNQFLLNIGSISNIPQSLKNAITKVLTKIGQAQEDIADWSPNPFFGYNKANNPNAGTKQLTLVDGGEDLQNVPLHPLIQPERAVDVIFAVDSSADTLGRGANWPNATALVATYQRSLDPKIQNGTAFPAIPDQNTIVNLGLNKRPTFFGCNSANQTGPSPLIVYVPNAPYVYFSNHSTFDMDYNNTERDAMVRNGYLVGTMGNSTVDEQWPTCLGCAILSRSLERTKTKVPDVCTKCFQRYCWNGTVDSKTPAKPYEPSLIMDEIKTGGKKNAAVGQSIPSFLSLGFAAALAALAMY